MRPTLYHFSDDPEIERFVPRPVKVPPERKPGMAWLNGPLVWAIDAWHQPMYLFPRDCPRILLWPTAETTNSDRAQYFGESSARMIAYVEEAWLGRLSEATLYRYLLPPETFRSLDDAGMWVSPEPVVPQRVEALTQLPTWLAEEQVELRPLPSLTPLRDVWETSLHASGIRLRNAAGWR